MTQPLPDRRGRVLFADDDQPARDAMARMLIRLGFECVTVATAAEAVAMLRSGDFDVLLSDIHMPGNASLELVEEVGRLMPGLPVILLTGQPSVETATRSVRLPVTAYLTKPPDLTELTSGLEQAIEGYRNVRLIRDGRSRLIAWEQELARVEQLVSRPAASAGGGAMQDYLRVSLRQVIGLLTDIEQATRTLDRQTGERLRQIDQVAALRHTVEVLERTRQNFKSKELADLRRQLEWLLAGGTTGGDRAEPTG